MYINVQTCEYESWKQFAYRHAALWQSANFIYSCLLAMLDNLYAAKTKTETSNNNKDTPK